MNKRYSPSAVSELLDAVIQEGLNKHDSNHLRSSEYHNLRQGHNQEFIIIIDEDRVPWQLSFQCNGPNKPRQRYG